MNRICTAEIRLPSLSVEARKIAGNRIIQLGQKEEVINGEIFQITNTCLLFKETKGREFYLKLPRSKFTATPGSNILKVKNCSTAQDINVDTSLSWESHACLSDPQAPDDICTSWADGFHFRKETETTPGLRRPQIGAVHSIAANLSLGHKCGTIVMPTGTGKTETMMATLISQQCKKVLVIVPSKVLRKQTYDKFACLGCLKDVGVLDPQLVNPRIAMIEHGISSTAEARELFEGVNVIVSTVAALNRFENQVKQLLAESCSHIFIDEAHHVAARTWNEIKELFKDKFVLQFTATPFRRDHQRIEGDIIYNYSLGMAQEDGYFRNIKLSKIQEFDDSVSDNKIAEAAVEVLNQDLLNKLDHILMARCKSKARADEIVGIYQEISPEHNPIAITSDLSNSGYLEALERLQRRDTRILVCVDMLGEGFDLPNLKIAALHDTHKSLAITLQFIGRFTRAAHNVGDATAVINVSDPQVSRDLENMYSEDADWNKLLRQKSESSIQKEIDFHKFINSFTGELADHISLWNLRPSFSTLIYETDCENWCPEKFEEVIPKSYKYWHAINVNEKILVVVISKEEDVKWGRYKDIKNHSFELCVAHWSDKHKALFLQCSDYDAFKCTPLAKAICGESTNKKTGPKVFNVFSGIQRTLARNVGVSTVGKISYTMHFGNDITEGLTKVQKATSTLSNIFGWGYSEGEKVGRGCSARGGKIWSRGGGPISDWKDWCLEIGDKVFDDSIEQDKIIDDFLKPEQLIERYKSVPLMAEWSENLLVTDENNISVFFGEKEYKLYDVGLDIVERSEEGPVVFKIFSEYDFSTFKINYTEEGCNYELVDGQDVKIKKYSGEALSVIDYFKDDPISIFYGDGSFSYNDFHVPTPVLSSFFNKDKLSELDWSGTNIQVESMGKEIKEDSVQAKVFEMIKNEYEIIINDDAAGEAADLIALRQESSDSFKLHLIHCKFSSQPAAGSRIDEFYTLCGQAQKSIKWKHNGMQLLCNHIIKRELAWKQDGKTRFLKGNVADLNKLKKFSRYAAKGIFEVSIVQPGLSKSAVSDDIIQILGATEDYLMKTSGAAFNVFCSA